jgi:hypothetical protein
MFALMDNDQQETPLDKDLIANADASENSLDFSPQNNVDEFTGKTQGSMDETIDSCTPRTDTNKTLKSISASMSKTNINFMDETMDPCNFEDTNDAHKFSSEIFIDNPTPSPSKSPLKKIIYSIVLIIVLIAVALFALK